MNSSSFSKYGTTILLYTVVVNVIDRMGNLHKVRFLLDSASQANFITHKCAKRLKLFVQNFHTCMNGISSSASQVQGQTNLVIISRLDSDKKYAIDALVVEKITDQLPSFKVQTKPLAHLLDLPLADDTFYQPGEIDAILGANIFSYVLGKTRISGSPYTPMALETSLSYIVMGSVPIIHSSKNPRIFCSLLEPSVEKFWEIEEISVPSILSKDDIDCENIYKSTYSIELDGRYTVALPFKLDPSNLGDSYSTTYRRFINLEKKLESYSPLRLSYNEVMLDYLSQNHMSKISDDELSTPGYYIPHHGLSKLDSLSTLLE